VYAHSNILITKNGYPENLAGKPYLQNLICAYWLSYGSAMAQLWLSYGSAMAQLWLGYGSAIAPLVKTREISGPFFVGILEKTGGQISTAAKS
jgi:hypothetical protein